ncbi:hypothetical protein [Draconibacterium orientale]|uniref:hypothetical protein n=1 Tax=Draconibacterium orientale TaxID=1168034 RepID=UPI002A0A7506|nr:hypothetical protein [Draconibacterium orientale]
MTLKASNVINPVRSAGHEMTKAKSSGEESRSKPDGFPGRNSKDNTDKNDGAFFVL